MSLLDRFKPQPRWKHADPAVRLSAIQALDDEVEDTAGVLASLAAEDPDVRVRRTAVSRLQDPAVLGRAAHDDADEAVRQKAIERLLALAQDGVTSNGGFTRAEAALAALNEPRHLAAVAKGEADDRLRRRAVERLTDSKALGSVARHAKDAGIAALAVELINDPNELLNVAMKTDHKQAGVLAVDRLAVASPADRTAFEQIAERAAEKAVSRRARAAVQAIDDAETARRAAEEAERQRQLEREREEARLAREREQQARDAAREAALAPRRALCERMESAVEEAKADDIERARAEWEGLPTSDEWTEDVDALRARFEKACGAVGHAVEARAAADAARARLDELAASAETTAAVESLGEAKIGLAAIEQEWRSLEPHLDALGEAGAATRARYAAARDRVTAREAERHAAETKALADNLRRLERLADRIEKRAPAQDLTLREAERAMKELRPAIDEPGPLPTKQDRDTIVERLKNAQALLAPRARELREMDDWKRFANAAVQEDLCARTEALLKRIGEPDPPGLDAVAKDLREINAKWREAAEAPRAQAQALWHRYRRAFDPIQLLCREHFAAQAQERAANLTAKLAICERAEAVAESTDWIKTADELRALQAEWQTIGPVPHEHSKAIWQRFRSACNRFFTRRHDDLAKRKEIWAGNQAKKVALCERAEALAESTEWDAAAAELRRLQNEWKTIGPVKKTKAEALWNRFRAGCDRFFERYKQRDAIALEARVQNREAAVVAFEELAASATPERDAAELRDAVRDVRRRWDQAGPIPTDRMAPLDARYNEALERILTARPDVFRGSDLDPEANLQKLEKLCVRIEKLAADEQSQPTSSEALAAMLREALAANTIGGRPSEESRIKAAIEEVRQAQAAWRRVGPAPRDAVNELSRRFHRACDRVFEQQRKRVPVGPPAR
ncbi:MAG TPA: DUF349 domain-containing protein [Vicinamibacterales bacterium]